MLENDNKNTEVFKDHLLGFVLIKTKYDEGHTVNETHYIHPEPITADYECYSGIDGSYNVALRSDRDEVIGIIPAQSGSLAVYFSPENGSAHSELIGYEFPGAEHPDWNKLIQSIKKNNHL